MSNKVSDSREISGKGKKIVGPRDRDCQNCGARKGEPCVLRTGKPMELIHCIARGVGQPVEPSTWTPPATGLKALRLDRRSLLTEDAERQDTPEAKVPSGTGATRKTTGVTNKSGAETTGQASPDPGAEAVPEPQRRATEEDLFANRKRQPTLF